MIDFGIIWFGLSIGLGILVGIASFLIGILLLGLFIVLIWTFLIGLVTTIKYLLDRLFSRDKES